MTWKMNKIIIVIKKFCISLTLLVFCELLLLLLLSDPRLSIVSADRVYRFRVYLSIIDPIRVSIDSASISIRVSIASRPPLYCVRVSPLLVNSRLIRVYYS